MNFDYKTLRQYAAQGQNLGMWNGKKVYAASEADLDNLGSGVFYIVYDDDNKIVNREGNKWFMHGFVSAEGTVNETRVRPYKAIEPKKKEEEATPHTTGYDVEERPIGDVKMGLDVEATLKAAREMTVDSLLEGFNYGL